MRASAAHRLAESLSKVVERVCRRRRWRLLQLRVQLRGAKQAVGCKLLCGGKGCRKGGRGKRRLRLRDWQSEGAFRKRLGGKQRNRCVGAAMQPNEP
eukprot:3326024-Pleurochrysis_carterae.AAC.2